MPLTLLIPKFFTDIQTQTPSVEICSSRFMHNKKFEPVIKKAIFELLLDATIVQNHYKSHDIYALNPEDLRLIFAIAHDLAIHHKRLEKTLFYKQKIEEIEKKHQLKPLSPDKEFKDQPLKRKSKKSLVATIAKMLLVAVILGTVAKGIEGIISNPIPSPPLPDLVSKPICNHIFNQTEPFLLAVANEGESVFKCAHPDLWSNETLRGEARDIKYKRSTILYEISRVIAAHEGQPLDKVDPIFLKARKIVEAAVKKNGFALRHAPEFQDDLEIVLAAVAQHPYALAYASPRLRGNMEILRTIFNSSSSTVVKRSALEYATNEGKSTTEYQQWCIASKTEHEKWCKPSVET